MRSASRRPGHPSPIHLCIHHLIHLGPFEPEFTHRLPVGTPHAAHAWQSLNRAAHAGHRPKGRQGEDTASLSSRNPRAAKPALEGSRRALWPEEACTTGRPMGEFWLEWSEMYQDEYIGGWGKGVQDRREALLINGRHPGNVGQSDVFRRSSLPSMAAAQRVIAEAVRSRPLPLPPPPAEALLALASTPPLFDGNRNQTTARHRSQAVRTRFGRPTWDGRPFMLPKPRSRARISVALPRWMKPVFVFCARVPRPLRHGAVEEDRGRQ